MLPRDFDKKLAAMTDQEVLNIVMHGADYVPEALEAAQRELDRRNVDVKVKDWPFDQPRNCAVFTQRSIIFGNDAILRVSHNARTGWQFLNGDRAETSNVAVVGLEKIVNHDRSVLELADMPPGWFATRESPASPWHRMPYQTA